MFEGCEYMGEVRRGPEFAGQLHCAGRFKKKGKKWYNWSDEQARDEWDRAVKDPTVPRATDAFGNLTLAKLSRRTAGTGCRVSTNRSVREESNHALRDGEDRGEVVQQLKSSRCPKESKADKNLGVLESRLDVQAGAGDLMSQGLRLRALSYLSALRPPIPFESANAWVRECQCRGT